VILDLIFDFFAVTPLYEASWNTELEKRILSQVKSVQSQDSCPLRGMFTSNLTCRDAQRGRYQRLPDLAEKPFVTDISTSGRLAGALYYETALTQLDTRIFAPYSEGARRGFRYEEDGYSVYLYENGEVRGTGAAADSQRALSIVNSAVTKFIHQLTGLSLVGEPSVEEIEVGRSVSIDPNILISEGLLRTLQTEYGKDVKVKSVEILISPPKGLARLESISPIRPGEKSPGPVLVLCRAETYEEAVRALTSLQTALRRRELK
jgi:hypothetical protein